MSKRKDVILGMGASGRAVADYLLASGEGEVVRVDNLGAGGALPDYDLEKLGADSLIVSPGIPPENRLYRAALRMGMEIIGETEFALRRLDNKILAVTGTNGKTTTALLLGHVLNEIGKRARLLGNSHAPLTSCLGSIDRDEIIVLELSSYQLDTLKSRKIDAAAVLNIGEDHLDRYGSLEVYAASKLSIARFLKKNGKLFMERDLFDRWGYLLKGVSPELFIVFKENIELLLKDCYRGKSEHDIKNMAAAFALAGQVGVAPDEFIGAARDFKNPEHRLEFLRAINGVEYYNDSKATNPDAVVAAVRGLGKGIWLIVGGSDKKTSYVIWQEAFRGRVKGVFAIGETKREIERDLGGVYPYLFCSDLEEAFRQASARAKSGDKVLLSPGCASFDMFESYKKRGEVFKDLVYNIGDKNE